MSDNSVIIIIRYLYDEKTRFDGGATGKYFNIT
jgi:hypothetical protein